MLKLLRIDKEGTEMTIEEAETYLNLMEKNRAKDEPNNKKAYQDARILSGWVSVAKYGTLKFSNRAKSFVKTF